MQKNKGFEHKTRGQRFLRNGGNNHYDKRTLHNLAIVLTFYHNLMGATAPSRPPYTTCIRPWLDSTYSNYQSYHLVTKKSY